jgi:hypothetical protein
MNDEEPAAASRGGSSFIVHRSLGCPAPRSLLQCSDHRLKNMAETSKTGRRDEPKWLSCFAVTLHEYRPSSLMKGAPMETDHLSSRDEYPGREVPAHVLRVPGMVSDAMQKIIADPNARVERTFSKDPRTPAGHAGALPLTAAVRIHEFG